MSWYINSEKLSVIVARYEEDMLWLHPFFHICTIYNKGSCINNDINNINKIKKVVDLPNVGREAHSYLYHIINNYDDIEGILLFTQGNIKDHLPAEYTEFNYFMKLISSAIDSGFSFNAYNHNVGSMSAHKDLKMADKWDNLKNSGMTFGEWLQDISNFNNNYNNNYNNIKWYMNSIFAIDAKLIKKYPKSFYEYLISFVDDHKDPEAGHYFERAWYEILVENNNNVK